MKRILTCILLVFIFLAAGMVNAQNIVNSNLSESEEITFNLKNLSEINTVSKKDACFILVFELKDTDYAEYDIEYQIDDEKPVYAGTEIIEPGKKNVKEFPLNVKNGSHKLKVNIYRKKSVVKSFEEDLVVMDKYVENFMDFYNPSGFNTHFAHYASNDLTQTGNLNIFKLLDWSGTKRIRDGFMPHRTEPYPGNYKFFGSDRWRKAGDSWVGWWLEPFIRTDYELYAPYMAPINSEYYKDLPKDIEETRREARTTKSITGFSNFIVASLKAVPNINAIEIWNEPNISNFWTSQEDVEIDYPNLLKQAALTVREYSDDIRIDAFSVTNDLQAFVDPISEHYGVYPYYDCISFHPYVWSMDMEDRDKYNDKISNLADAVERYGGWKQLSITETGQSVYNGVKMNDGRYMTERDAASKNIKQIIMGTPFGVEQVDIYQLMSDTVLEKKDPNNREHGFGIVRRHADGTLVPQDSYIAIKEYSQQLSGAIFIGRVNLGENVYAYLYQKDGLPKLVLWYYDSEYKKQTISFNGENLNFFDMFGNILKTDADEISVGIEPYYVTGLSNAWFERAAKEEITRFNVAWKENYADLLSSEILLKAEKLFDDVQNALDSSISDKEIGEFIDKYFDYGYEIIKAGQENQISDKDVSAMLFGLYKAVNVLNNCYIAEYEDDNKVNFDINEANSFINNSYKNRSGYIKQYTDAIYKYAKLYKSRADKVASLKEENKVKAGVVNGWNSMAKNLFGWAKEFSESEPVKNYGLTVRVPGYDTMCFVGETKHIRSVLRNASELDFYGKLEVYDESNELVSQTSEFNLKPGTVLDKTVDVILKEPANGEYAYYTFVLVDKDGNRVVEQQNKLTVKKSVLVEVLPINDEIEDVEKITLKIKSQMDKKYSINLNVETSENISIGKNNMDITLAPKEERLVDIPVTSIENTKFHCYALTYTAKDLSDAIVANATQLLSITNIVKAKIPISVESFNGDISEWYDAYPIYAGQPGNAANYDGWKDSSCSMRSFLKWNDENLYLLTEVYDDIQYQDYIGSQIWQGDSVQIALDCNNDKTDGYNDDDYELGMALCSDGVGFYAWHGDVNDNEPDKWIKIVRDEETKITRYLMVMSRNNIGNLKLSEGKYIGLNIAVNDSDVLGREGFIQFTDGLADEGGKCPYKYENFKFCSEKKYEFKDGYNIFK